MAAVAPHLEESLSKPIEGKAARKAMRLPVVNSGYSWGPTEKEDPTMNLRKVLEKEHQNLTRIVVLRQAANEALKGKKLRVEDGRLIITPGLEEYQGPVWSPMPDVLDSYPLLSWTKKMQCPSFSLPAGAMQNAGSCPAATIAQTTVKSEDITDLETKQEALQVAYGRPKNLPLSKDEIPLWYALSTCQSCYAESDNYQRSNNVIGLSAIYSWTKQAVSNGTFVDTMIETIENANYFQKEAAPDGGDPEADVPHLEDTPYKRFFRWHDAGDVFSEKYMQQIKQICDHFNPKKGGKGTPTLFWMPTRVWALETSRDWVKVNDDPDTNLIVRPSSLHVNGTAPSAEAAGPGNMAGSTVYVANLAKAAKEAKHFDHDCPAANKEFETNTCRKARCRACWTKPDEVINYRLH